MDSFWSKASKGTKTRGGSCKKEPLRKVEDSGGGAEELAACGGGSAAGEGAGGVKGGVGGDGRGAAA